MKKVKTIRISSAFIFIVVFIFLCLIYRLVYVGTGHIKVGSQTLKEFASQRQTIKKTIRAKRGTIYSSSGEVLAKDVNSYTVIAYLSPSRTKDKNKPHHVVDKEKTAEALSPLIGMSPKKILSILNTKIETCDEYDTCIKESPYQVELGPGGRGITELVKEQIEDLLLPGIDFIASTKRYYPNGNFLSYTLGYVKKDEKTQESFGEMGSELYFNDDLTGENGYTEYQCDLQGYQITNAPAVNVSAHAGNDIYFTIDDNIQMYAEQAITSLEEGKPSWAAVAVADAKTGAILGLASSPSFNNNSLEIKSYNDPFVSYTFEPGSTMKIFSFLAAMENGIYDGNATYSSGRIKVDDAVIKDWNGYGWGTITYDQGFMGSSNVAASKLALKLGRAKLKDFYTNLGFGQKTGFTLPNEEPGIINFRYNTEIASASFGQGITVNVLQMVQALTTLSNEGTMLKPYIVSKIVDSESNETIFEGKRTEVRKVASKENVDKMIDLMRGVVDGRASMSTGKKYNIKGYDLVGKTGTAEIASSSGGYLSGSSDYTRSFAGLFPGKDPSVIVYVAASKISSSKYMYPTVKNLVKDVGTYLNLYGEEEISDYENIFTVGNYINKNTESVLESLKESKMNVITLGSGNKIINQYPKANQTLNLGSKIFLVSNKNDYKMINIKGWSRNEVSTFASLTGLNTSYLGHGYVKEYSIEEGKEINSGDTLEITLEEKYKEEEENKTSEDKKDTKTTTKKK